MEKLITDILAVIEKYRLDRSLTFVEALGALKLCSDHLSEVCRKNMSENGEVK